MAIADDAARKALASAGASEPEARKAGKRVHGIGWILVLHEKLSLLRGASESAAMEVALSDFSELCNARASRGKRGMNPRSARVYHISWSSFRVVWDV